MTKQKKKVLTVSLEKYTDEQLSNITIDKIQEMVELIIDLQLGIKNRVNCSANAILSKNDVNGMLFPFFRVIRSLNDLLYFRFKPCGNGMGIIFKQLKEMYMRKGQDANTAMKEAHKTLMDFYSAAADICKDVKGENGELIKKGYAPFVVNIFAYNKDEPKDSFEF